MEAPLIPEQFLQVQFLQIAIVFIAWHFDERAVSHLCILDHFAPTPFLLDSFPAHSDILTFLPFYSNSACSFQGQWSYCVYLWICVVSVKSWKYGFMSLFLVHIKYIVPQVLILFPFFHSSIRSVRITVCSSGFIPSNGCIIFYYLPLFPALSSSSYPPAMRLL